MCKLKGLSFNGLDTMTNLSRAMDIQEKYPLVEFGVLLSGNWSKNGNRYFNPNFIKVLWDFDLNLSLHLCGRIARRAIRNDFQPGIDLCGGYFNLFQRVQINIASYGDKNPKDVVLDIPETVREVIIQQKSADDCKLFTDFYTAHKDSLGDKVSVLIDGSGGNGVETELNILETTAKVGYAGGIKEENIISKLDYLMEHTDNFWIDLESGARTDDYFDLGKIERMCEAIYSHLGRPLYT